MNKICETCDTKNRLNLCTGKTGTFKYCYRKTGSIEGTKESIQPFDEIKELNNKLDLIDIKSIHMVDYGEHMNLLLGKYLKNIDDSNQEYPLGFIIK